MPRYKTQDQCRQMAVEAMEAFKAQIDEIDSETPWSASEPGWWLSMQNIRGDVFRFIKEHGDNDE